jgi:hypothetical protein
MPLYALTHPINQFLLVILLVKVTKGYFLWKEKMSRHTGGVARGQRNVTKCHQGMGGGSKKIHVLFEWPLTLPGSSKLPTSICHTFGLSFI